MSKRLLVNGRRWGLCKQSLSVEIQGHRHHGLTTGGDRAAHGVNDQSSPIALATAD